MYESFYRLEERPFSITPNPRFVYLSQRHQDALAHLLYGVGQGGSGGFVQLTGEVGTGKTTLCRLLLEQIPAHNRVALILNPMLSPPELLRAICAELEIEIDPQQTNLQVLQDQLNRYLMARHAENERVVLIIDEAQNMSREALEQVRLLTNLETATDKLLQIILIGQPELRLLLARPELRQLAQRITARYHLNPLDRDETEGYVRHRLAVAGAPRCPFSNDGLKALHQCADGIPRLINIIADRALMAGYARELDKIDARTVRAAAREVAGDEWDEGSGRLRAVLAIAVVGLVLAGGTALGLTMKQTVTEPQETLARPAWQTLLEHAPANEAWSDMAALWPGLSTADIASACGASSGPEQRNGNPAVCLQRQGSWAYIERIDLPVVLRLGQGEQTYAVLSGIDHDMAVLSHRGQVYRAPLRQLDRLWLGRFHVVWPDDGEILRLGDRGESVRLAKSMAAQVADPPWTGPGDDRYDERFRDWVVAFQRHHGISDDGMVGPETRLFLGVPHLTGPHLIRPIDGD
ncbi:MAG: AAA family ATPase [Wenzhouxiangella sp.]